MGSGRVRLDFQLQKVFRRFVLLLLRMGNWDVLLVFYGLLHLFGGLLGVLSVGLEHWYCSNLGCALLGLDRGLGFTFVRWFFYNFFFLFLLFQFITILSLQLLPEPCFLFLLVFFLVLFFKSI